MVRIVWSDQSLEEIDLISNYIAKDSIQYAKTFVQNVFHKVENLIEFPELGRIVPEFNDTDYGN